MAWVLRSTNNAGNNSGAALTIPMGAGIASGDLDLVAIYLETDTNTIATPPSGYTLVQSGVNTGAFGLYLYYKIAGASEPSTSFTPTSSAWRTAVSACFSGGSGSGSFVDVTSAVSQADAVVNTSQTAPSVTTTAANDLLIWVYGNFSGNNPATTTGAASTVAVSFGGLSIAYATIASASATGTTSPNAGIGTETYAAFHAAFLLTGAGGGGGATPVTPLFFQQANAVYRM